MKTIRQAAQALCDRWDTHAPHTAVFVHELRTALASEEAQTVEPAAWMKTYKHGGGKITQSLSINKPETNGFAAIEVVEPLFTHRYASDEYNIYRIYLDGDMWCAVGPNFVDLQESKAGFGKTPNEAIADLLITSSEPAKSSGDRESFITHLRNHSSKIGNAAADMLAADAQEIERKYICPVRTVADLANNLSLMDQELPIYGAQYIDHPSRGRCAIAVSPTVSRERVQDSRWIGHGTELNAAIVWTRAAQQVAVPQGWKLVPVEPTPTMRDKACGAWLDCGSKLVLNKALAAMRAGIAAAPQPPQAEEPCYCDKQGIGEPGVSCGDCPRDYLPQPVADDAFKPGWAGYRQGVEDGKAGAELGLVADLTDDDIDSVRDSETCPASVICLSAADVLWIGRAVLAAQKGKTC